MPQNRDVGMYLKSGGQVSRGATMVGAEREHFQHLEPLGRRKRPFQSLNSTFSVGSFRCTNEGLRKFIPYLIVRSISAFVQSVPDQ
jgi:hypothetical protein